MAVQFKFTGDDKDVQRALERMEKQYNALIATTKKGTDETKKMAAEAKKVFEETRTPLEKYNARLAELQKLAKAGALSIEDVGRAAKMARQELQQTQKSESGSGGLAAMGLKAVAAYGALRGVIAGVNSELERKNQLERTVADKQQDMANKQREALINLGTATKQERSEILGGLAGISAKTGVKQSDLMAALPGLTSAQGALSTGQMMSALEVAARIAPHNAETMGELALGLENTASLTGSKDMMENMGFQLGIGRGTQIKNLGDINKYLIRGAIGVKGFGGSATDSAAIVSTMTSLLKDTEGRIGQTSSISMAHQLDQFLPEKDTFKFDDKGRKKLAKRGTGLTDTIQRMEFMRANPDARERFMSEGSFEHQAIAATRDFLTAGGEAEKLLEQRRNGEIKLGPAAKATAADFVSTVEADRMQQGAASVRAGEAIVEKMQLGDEGGGRNARARKMLMDAMDASGAFGIDAWSTGKAFDVTGLDSPEDEAAHLLEQRKWRMQMTPWGGNDEAKKISGIDEVITELKKISSQQRNRDPERHAE